jgi:AbrB family looped-hinge helix DNA binding protein
MRITSKGQVTIPAEIREKAGLLPHTEVELIVVNGVSVEFSYVVHDGDRVAVYPVFESLDVSPALRVRPSPLRDPRFVLDVHLGKLAAYMRMLGFDTLYRNCLDDAELARISATHHRTLLTRDRGLLKRGAVTHGYWLRATDSRAQLAEIVHRFDLARAIRPFTRCMACNGVLKPVAKAEVQRELPPRIAEAFDDFRQCDRCRRVFWQGSHYRRMQQQIEQLTAANQNR